MMVLKWILMNWANLCAALAAFVGFASLVTGMVPISVGYRSSILVFLRWASGVMHADEPGTFKRPFSKGRTISVDQILATGSLLATFARRPDIAHRIDTTRAELAPLEVPYRAAPPPPAPPTPPVPPAAGALLLALAVGGLLLGLGAVALPGCSGAQARRSAIGVEVSLGGVTQAMYSANTAAYVNATNALIARGLTGDAYDTASAPLTATYRARTHALNAVNGSLYAGAEIINAARTGDPAAYRAAARQALDALVNDLGVLQVGDVLPPVPLPAGAMQVIRTLATLAEVAMPDIATTSSSSPSPSPAPGGAS
jgi:hypothetical protein